MSNAPVIEVAIRAEQARRSRKQVTLALTLLLLRVGIVAVLTVLALSASASSQAGLAGQSPSGTPAAKESGTSSALDTPVCGPNLIVVPSPNVTPGLNILYGAAAISSIDMWAVGLYYEATTSRTLVEHWDGSTWGVVPSPNVGTYNTLRGVSAVSGSDVWAVGDYDAGINAERTLVEHWNGSTWSVVPSPNPAYAILFGVTAISGSDVWAVGYYDDGGRIQTLTEHWNGSAWDIVPSPSIGSLNILRAVSAVSSGDVWAVGDYVDVNGEKTLVEHWNGSTWSVIPSPNAGTGGNELFGVAAVSGSDVWAVGEYLDGSVGKTLVEHWNGSTWSVIPSPNAGTGDSVLRGAGAISATDVWAVGDYDGGSQFKTLVEHWNGSTWSVVPSPNVGAYRDQLSGVAVVSSNDVWAVGDYYDGLMRRTLVERWNACPSSPTLTPTSTATSCPIQFPDVPVGSTFYPYIRCLACRGIINGFPDGTFEPNNPITRGQLSKIVSNAAGFSDPQPNQMFQDVPVGSTFQVSIGRLAVRGYVSGYACGGPGEPCGPGNLPYFRPNNKVTRGQTSKIDANAAGFSDAPSGLQFEDVPIGSAYYTYTYRLVSRGVMSGYPCGGVWEPCVPPNYPPYFRPDANATRGQTSKIVANTFFPGCQTPTGPMR